MDAIVLYVIDILDLRINKKLIINCIQLEHIYLAAVTRPLWSGVHKRVGYTSLMTQLNLIYSSILKHLGRHHNASCLPCTDGQLSREVPSTAISAAN